MKNNIVKPSILPGFMELIPEQQLVFEKMKDIIIEQYKRFGFLPIDTPVIEKSEILLAKGGGETEKQIYRVDKGDTDMSLRFDLTVPLARYVAQHYSELEFPFRRYQIGKVYRGERNQRGRFREFYQCDVDILGNGKLGLMNDAELPPIIYSIFKKLGFKRFSIKINNRKLLKGFFESIDIMDFTLVLRTIDKIDKIGIDAVKDELRTNGIKEEAITKIIDLISITGTTDEKLKTLKEMNIENELFNEGIIELETVFKYVREFSVPDEFIKFEIKLARGLDYYTGTIYETILDDHESFGSVCGGGRYDNLAEHYTTQKLPGVGISIGLTRLFFQLKEAGLLNFKDVDLISALIIPMEGYEDKAIDLSGKLREMDVSCLINSEKGKMAKKFSYANKLRIPYVVIIGEDEVKNSVYTVKDMESGEQNSLNLDQLLNLVK